MSRLRFPSAQHIQGGGLTLMNFFSEFFYMNAHAQSLVHGGFFQEFFKNDGSFARTNSIESADARTVEGAC